VQFTTVLISVSSILENISTFPLLKSIRYRCVNVYRYLHLNYYVLCIDIDISIMLFSVLTGPSTGTPFTVTLNILMSFYCYSAAAYNNQDRPHLAMAKSQGLDRFGANNLFKYARRHICSPKLWTITPVQQHWRNKQRSNNNNAELCLIIAMTYYPVR
jgi:hypothetical protein